MVDRLVLLQRTEEGDHCHESSKLPLQFHIVNVLSLTYIKHCGYKKISSVKLFRDLLKIMELRMWWIKTRWSALNCVHMTVLSANCHKTSGHFHFLPRPVDMIMYPGRKLCCIHHCVYEGMCTRASQCPTWRTDSWNIWHKMDLFPQEKKQKWVLWGLQE